MIELRRRWMSAAVLALILVVGSMIPAFAAVDEDRYYELGIYDAHWDGDTGYADWTEAADARRYEVKVYRGTRLLNTSSRFSTAPHYDLSSYITQKGEYTFKVRAVYSNTHMGDWAESEKWEVNEKLAKNFRDARNEAQSAAGKGGTGVWLEDDTGWWYRNTDGSYTKNNWQYIDNKWYYFDENGYMVTGWVYWKEKYYCCGENGDMLMNTWTPDGYFVDGDGIWVEGHRRQV